MERNRVSVIVSWFGPIGCDVNHSPYLNLAILGGASKRTTNDIGPVGNKPVEVSQ
jgi:hypothetical protein